MKQQPPPSREPAQEIPPEPLPGLIEVNTVALAAVQPLVGAMRRVLVATEAAMNRQQMR